MKKVVTSSRVVIKGTDGIIKWLEKNGSKSFDREVWPEEKLEESVNKTFETLGLDTTELDKIQEGIEETENGELIIKYRLETDPLSLLEFLISEEGRESGLELGE